MWKNQRCTFGLTWACLCLGMVAIGNAGPKIVVGTKVPLEQRLSMEKVDHRDWSRLLKTYVDSQGRVAYARWQRHEGDRRALTTYLNDLSRADAKRQASRQAKLAYWINAYNAVTIHGILREYPTTSIRNHTAKLFGYNIWHDLLLIVGDTQISLNDIEHEILRKSGDFRIHFAIVCASHSCPRLLNTAYTGPQMEQQLETSAQVFFRNPENYRYEDGTFYLSSILQWFATDFGNTSAAQLQAIARYLPDPDARKVASQGRGKIAYLKYDWSLNDQATRR